MSFKTDLTKSQKIFNLIKPDLEQRFNCKVIEVENNNADACMKLDTVAGIDYLLYSEFDNIPILDGLASRIQCGINRQTFTIRYKKASGCTTEHEKRKFAIDNGCIYPKYTLQAYFTGNSINYAVCYTKDLIEHLESIPEQKREKNNTSNADFYIVKWDKVRLLANVNIQLKHQLKAS